MAPTKNARDVILTASERELVDARGLFMFWVVAREAMMRLVTDEALPLAGNIAFRTILSIFPFLIFLTSLAGYFGTPHLADGAINFLLDVAPEEIVEGLAPEIRSLITGARTDLISLSILLTIWTASAGVDSLRVGLNRAYDLEEHRSMAVLFGQNALFVLIFAAALMLLAFLIVLAPIALAFIEQHLPGLLVYTKSIDALRYPVAFTVLFLALYAAHIFLPARWQFLDLLPGILFTLIIWLVLAAAYSRFLHHFATFASTYAGLAGVIIAIYFIYLSALVFIFGGEINRAVRLRRKAREGRLGAPPSGRDKAGEAESPLDS